MLVEAPTAMPQGFPNDEENRFPVTPEIIIRIRYFSQPRKYSAPFPSIRRASIFQRICQIFKCRIIGEMSR